MIKITKITKIFLVTIIISSCGSDNIENKVISDPVNVVVDPMTDKGIGPITSIDLGDINSNSVEEGKKIFKSKCSACHKIDKRYIGPALKGIINRRTPEWIMNMIMNPEEMLIKNEIAKQLLIEYSAPMANQGINEEDARKILEFLRTEN